MMAECFHNGRALMRGKPVVLEDEADFRLFLLRDLFDLAFFASALLLVMLRIAACRQVASQSHGNGAGGNFSQASNHNQAGVLYRSRKPGSQGKGNSEAVGHADYNIAHRIAGGEMRFRMQNSRQSVTSG